MRKFYVASEEEIASGETTDVYFVRTKEILKAKKMENIRVLAEVTAGGLPENWPWGILCGVEEVARLFEGKKVDVDCMPEGTLFKPFDQNGVRVPVLTVKGAYGEFCEFETPMLGLLCQASGVATMAARMRKLVGNRILMAFGVRRIHPAMAPMVDRAAYVGGFDGVSSLIGAKVIGKKPMGTMPHSLIIVFGDQVKAWRAFDEVMPEDVPRIALADTYWDEKAEAIKAAENLGKRLAGVRLDTPGSRKGNFASIVREVRWELDYRGFNHVKIFVSGGIDDKNIKELAEAGADGFGVGTSLSNAPTIDFAMDIVEVEGKPAAKRGKLGGRKNVFRCERCLVDIVSTKSSERCRRCGRKMVPAMVPLVRKGKIVAKLPGPEAIRDRVLKQLEKISEV
ncbi:MAG: nicotinate phosphoribosyltransferase [Candidatus Hadarchaeales archaeon]